MLKIIIPCIFCFGLGIYFGHGLDRGSNSVPIVSLKDHRKSLTMKDCPAPPSQLTEDSVGVTHSKPASKNNFQKRKPFKTSVRVGKILQEIAEMPFFYDDGEPNLDVIDSYREILDLDPTNKEALVNYSNMLMGLRMDDEALSYLKKCVSAHPEAGLCHGNLTNFYMFKNNKKELEKAFKDCFLYAPSEPLCAYNRANFYLGRDQAKALEYFEKAESANNENAFARFQQSVIDMGKAQAYERMGNLTMATRFYDLACQDGQAFACKRIAELKGRN